MLVESATEEVDRQEQQRQAEEGEAAPVDRQRQQRRRQVEEAGEAVEPWRQRRGHQGIARSVRPHAR